MDISSIENGFISERTNLFFLFRTEYDHSTILNWTESIKLHKKEIAFRSTDNAFASYYLRTASKNVKS